MKKLFMHVCCAPCFVAPYYKLKEEFEINAFWYNPNIHPTLEYIFRRDCVREFVKKENINYIEINEYGLLEFLENTLSNLSERCYYCYYKRLEVTAMTAKENGYDFFSTTLLYSKFQKHELIVEIANKIAAEYDIPFFYQDLRELWKEGIKLSKDKLMYRQQYCGCIFSEMERYDILKNP